MKSPEYAQIWIIKLPPTPWVSYLFVCLFARSSVSLFSRLSMPTIAFNILKLQHSYPVYRPIRPCSSTVSVFCCVDLDVWFWPWVCLCRRNAALCGVFFFFFLTKPSAIDSVDKVIGWMKDILHLRLRRLVILERCETLNKLFLETKET